MIGDLRPYPAMKDSAVQWLGKVPEHWDVRRLKSLCRMKSGETITAEDLRDNGRFPVFGGNGIRGYVDDYTHNGSHVLIGRQGALCGNVHHAEGRFWASEHAVVVTLLPQGFSMRWLGQLLRVMDLRQYSIAAAQPGLAVERILDLAAPVPPPLEQAAIARFLGHADRQIRRYIRGKHKVITLLQEQKRAIIHRAVTRGLDSDVRLKPSGVEWLGEIPEHWQLVRLGSLLSERRETNDAGAVKDVLSLVRNRGVIPYAEKGNIGNKKSDDITRYKVVRPGDIVVNSMNVIIGSVGLSRYTGCLSPVYYVLVPRSSEDHHAYLNAVFQCRPFQRSLIGIGKGILAHRMRIPMELLKLNFCPDPQLMNRFR